MNTDIFRKFFPPALIALWCIVSIFSGLFLILMRAPSEKSVWLAEMARAHLEQAAILPDGKERSRHIGDAEKKLLAAIKQSPLDAALWKRATELYAQMGERGKAQEAHEIFEILFSLQDNGAAESP